MAYTKQTWVDGVNGVGGTQVNASRLTHIEDGIGSAATTADTAATQAAQALAAASVAGQPGAPGSQWRSGAGVPASGLGLVNDWYVNTTNGDYYQKTNSTTWVKIGSFTTVAQFPTYPTQAAAQAGLAAGEFADGAIIVIGP